MCDVLECRVEKYKLIAHMRAYLYYPFLLLLKKEQIARASLTFLLVMTIFPIVKIKDTALRSKRYLMT